jgi:hypothetical protein
MINRNDFLSSPHLSAQGIMAHSEPNVKAPNPAKLHPLSAENAPRDTKVLAPA